MDKLSLCSGVFFRQYDDIGIIVNTTTQNVCTLNLLGIDIVSLISRNKELRFKDLLAELHNKYCVYEMALRNDCMDFIEELQHNNFLKTNKTIITPKPDVDTRFPLTLEKEFSGYMCNRKQLFSCLIELTYRCNLNCVHCYAKNCGNKKDNVELTTNEVIDLIDNLYTCNVFKLTFTGGELFLRKDAYEIVEHAIKKGFLVDIFSNGTLLSESLIKAIANLHPRSYQSSLYSFIASKHDKITGEVGSFDKTLNTLKLFASYGVPINIKSIIMNLNQEDCEGLEELSQAIGATFQPGLSISPKNDGDKTPCVYRVKEIAALKKFFLKKRENSSTTELFSNRDINSSICGAALSSLSIDPYGNVFPCNSFNYPLGNIRKQKIEDIWNNLPALYKLREYRVSDLAVCRNCKYINYCTFGPGMALLETGSMFQPYSEACSHAKVQYELFN